MLIKYIIYITLLIYPPLYAEENLEREITIASAANIKFAIEIICQEFTKKYNVKTNLIINSSGALSTLIQNGAPIDVFLSADMAYPQKLFESGLTIDKPKIYAKGVLIYITFKDIENKNEDIISLIKKTEKFSIANPELAPYGKAAKEFLIKNAIYEEFENKIVYGKSILQVNQYIFTKTIDGAFTALSVVYTPFYDKEHFNYLVVNPLYYEPINQGAVIVKHQNIINKFCYIFLEFLLNEFSKTTFKENGYEVL